MADLTTLYMGLQLKNPFVVGSCSLTSKIEDIIKLEQAGASAVVLKSIFEEEILNEADQQLREAEANKLIYTQLSESLDYVDIHTQQKRLQEYLDFIKEAKSKVLIPVIASIHCVSDSHWIEFAKEIEKAGADAIELNLSLNPLDSSNHEKDKIIQRIVKKILKTVTIPVGLKISDRFNNLSKSILDISSSGIAGLTLFNRFFAPDIDIYNFKLVQGRMHSCETDYLKPLRWIALTADKANCSMAASTGVHDGTTAIKMILAGADAVQVVSALYVEGKDYIGQMITEMENWMTEKGLFSLKQFKGKASYKNTTNPQLYERIQFMKHFGRIGI